MFQSIIARHSSLRAEKQDISRYASLSSNLQKPPILSRFTHRWRAKLRCPCAGCPPRASSLDTSPRRRMFGASPSPFGKSSPSGPNLGRNIPIARWETEYSNSEVRKGGHAAQNSKQTQNYHGFGWHKRWHNNVSVKPKTKEHRVKIKRPLPAGRGAHFHLFAWRCLNHGPSKAVFVPGCGRIESRRTTETTARVPNGSRSLDEALLVAKSGLKTFDGRNLDDSGENYWDVEQWLR